MSNKIIKVKVHVPVEQYGFIEAELEGEPKEIAVEYFKIKDAFSKAKEDLPPFD